MATARAQVVLLVTIMVACAGPSRQVSARRALAAELVGRNQWDAAFGVVQALCTENPRDAEALLLRGIIYTEQKMLDEAQADLEQASQIQPGLARAHSALAIVFDMRGRSEDAIESHRRAVALEPRNPRYLNNLGFSLFASGRAREAIQYLHEALRVNPMDSKVRNNLGFAYAATGDFTRAAQQFDLAGDPAQAKNNLAWSYERKGALAQAYDLYTEAVRLNPVSSIARENLSRVAHALGKEMPESKPTPRS